MSETDENLAAVETRLQTELEQLRAERNGGSQPASEPDLVADTDPDVVAKPGQRWSLTTRGNADRTDPYTFELDGVEMYAAPVMPAGYLIFLLQHRDQMQQNMTRTEQIDIMMQMLEQLLLPESMQLLRERIHSAENPIEFEDLAKVLNHLTTQVYNRPTRQSSVSPDAQSTTGTTSTAGASPDASTSPISRTMPES